MISKLIYLYHKKNRYLQSYIQDLISKKTNFIPYKIKLCVTAKKNNSTEFNYFTFKYEGLFYELYNDNLKIINEVQNI